MSFRESGFRTYFSTVASPNSVNSYLSFLRSIDRAAGGLDEAIKEKGVAGVWTWAQHASVAPFDTRRSDSRSILKRYLGFVSDAPLALGDAASDSADEADSDSGQSGGLAFELERNMQAAVRRSIAALEDGLTIIDGGFERSVATGRIDILARDKDRALTIVELKAGKCPSGAIEQALGYADSLAAEENEQVRVIVVASSFSDRQVAAARRINDLKLYTYDYAVTFAEVHQ